MLAHDFPYPSEAGYCRRGGIALLLELVAEVEKGFAGFVGAGVAQIGQIGREPADARQLHDLVRGDLREDAAMRHAEDVAAGVREADCFGRCYETDEWRCACFCRVQRRFL